jgi:hypothetical protein
MRDYRENLDFQRLIAHHRRRQYLRPLRFCHMRRHKRLLTIQQLYSRPDYQWYLQQ